MQKFNKTKYTLYAVIENEKHLYYRFESYRDDIKFNYNSVLKDPDINITLLSNGMYSVHIFSVTGNPIAKSFKVSKDWYVRKMIEIWLKNEKAEILKTLNLIVIKNVEIVKQFQVLKGHFILEKCN